MSCSKYKTTKDASGTIYFEENIFVPKEEMERRTGRPSEEVGYEELLDAILKMLHDGERRIVFLDKTISEDAYSRISGYEVEQFIHNNLPGFWVEMKI